MPTVLLVCGLVIHLQNMFKLPPKAAASDRWVVTSCGIGINQVSTSGPRASCWGSSWEDELSGAGVGGGWPAAAAILQLSQPWRTQNDVTLQPQAQVSIKDEGACTCVLISSGMVFCWIQEWTSASSSLCSWVNQGWRGWSTRSFSLSSANTSFWSLSSSLKDLKVFFNQTLPVNNKSEWTFRAFLWWDRSRKNVAASTWRASGMSSWHIQVCAGFRPTANSPPGSQSHVGALAKPLGSSGLCVMYLTNHCSQSICCCCCCLWAQGPCVSHFQSYLGERRTYVLAFNMLQTCALSFTSVWRGGSIGAGSRARSQGAGPRRVGPSAWPGILLQQQVEQLAGSRLCIVIPRITGVVALEGATNEQVRPRARLSRHHESKSAVRNRSLMWERFSEVWLCWRWTVTINPSHLIDMLVMEALAIVVPRAARFFVRLWQLLLQQIQLQRRTGAGAGEQGWRPRRRLLFISNRGAGSGRTQERPQCGLRLWGGLGSEEWRWKVRWAWYYCHVDWGLWQHGRSRRGINGWKTWS